MEEKVVAIVFDAVTLGGDSAIADEYVAKSALKVATAPLTWKHAVTVFTYTQQRSIVEVVFRADNESQAVTHDPLTHTNTDP